VKIGWRGCPTEIFPIDVMMRLEFFRYHSEYENLLDIKRQVVGRDFPYGSPEYEGEKTGFYITHDIWGTYEPGICPRLKWDP
jgi:hypothetical protein